MAALNSFYGGDNMAIQGRLPCREGLHNCPYGQVCEDCPAIAIRKNPELRDSHKSGGFFSASLVQTKDKDGNVRFEYRNQE